MKRSLPKKLLASAALALFAMGAFLPAVAGIGLAFVPQSVHAQGAGGVGTAGGVTGATGAAEPATGIGAAGAGVGAAVDGVTDESIAESQDAAAANAGAQENKELDCGANVLCGLVQFVGAIFTYTSNLFAAVTGVLADFALWYSIQSSTYSLINPFLEAGWKLVRNLTNILFLFAILAVAFSLIFGTNMLGMEPKRTFGYIILMALLVNFSFFLTRVVIEIGNTTATVLYSSISTNATDTVQGDSNVSQVNSGSVVGQSTIGALGSPSTFYQNQEFAGMKSISLGILGKVNPQYLILNTMDVNSSGWLWKSYDWSFYILYLFLSFAVAAFNMVLIYIFVSMAILFMGRMVGLALAIIFAPLAFVSIAIPALRNREYIGFSDWIEQVVGLSLVAPIYLIFIYLTILFLNVNLFGTVTGYLLAAVTIFAKLLLVGMILLQGKKVAVSMSGHVGKMAGGLINTASGLALGAATGGTAMLARGTIGAAGSALARSGSLARIAESKPATDIDSVQRRMSFANSIRNIGVGKYRLGNTGFGKSVSDRVQSGAIGADAAKASAAQGLRAFGKNLYTVNPLDRSIGGMSARKAAGMLGGITGNGDLNKILAKDFVGSIQKNQARGRMLDIEASKNAKKTLTNVIGNAAAAGLANPTANPGGSTNPNATGSGPVTVTGPNTGAIPNPTGWSGAKGPVPGSKLPNDFNGMKLAPSVTNPAGSNPAAKPSSSSGDDTNPPNPPAGGATRGPTPPPDAGGAQAGNAAREQYEINQRQTAAAGGSLGNLTVKNLNVENITMGSATAPAGSSGRATSLLSGITSSTSPAALNYKPQAPVQTKPVVKQVSPSVPETDPMIQQMLDAKKEEIKKIEADRSQFIQDVNNMGQFDNAGTTKAMKTIEEYDTKRKAGYEALKDIKNTSVSGQSDQSGIIADNLPRDFGGIQLPEPEE